MYTYTYMGCSNKTYTDVYAKLYSNLILNTHTLAKYIYPLRNY